MKKKRKGKTRGLGMGRLDSFKKGRLARDGQEVSAGRMTRREQASW